MRLVRLATESFRNLTGGEVATDARFVVITGENGQGKTNLLEAVWLVASLRPLRGSRPKELVAWGQEQAAVGATVRGPSGTRSLRIGVGPRRELMLDGAPTADLIGWFQLVRAIAFTPQDASIVNEQPERRRAWLDRAAFTAWPTHLELVRDWQRVLGHKGVVLRQGRPDPHLLDALDAQLAPLSAAVAARRDRLIEELLPHIQAMHGAMAAEGGALSVAIHTAFPGRSVAERTEGYAASFAKARPDELRRAMCLVGPQRDDVRLLLDGQPARTFGSRGQVRTIVLALKLAELAAAHRRGDRPMFLLDDLSSELDHRRTRRLVGLLGDLDAQVWVTTTDPGHLGDLPSSESVLLHMAGGRSVVGGS